MKKYKILIIIAIYILLISNYSLLIAQAPQAFSYQAVIRTTNGSLLRLQTISLKMSLRIGSATGTVVYSEIHNASTDANGVVSIKIGKGSSIVNKFSDIDWRSGSYYLQTEADVTGGGIYTDMGSSKLFSVPYALYAANSGSTGLVGPTGATGNKGARGATGEKGQQGVQGLTGETGLKGIMGDMGVNGATGAEGPTGIAGAMGDTGAKGVTGNKGVTGPTGITGISYGGNNKQVLYNDNGNMAGTDDLVYNKATTNVGIGTSTPDASARLDITSTTKGFLLPRMTDVQREAIKKPVDGLEIYNITTGCLNIFKKLSWYEECGTNTMEVPVATSNSPICPGYTLNLSAQTITEATYSWTGPNNFTSSLQNPQITNFTLANKGDYTVVANVGNNHNNSITTVDLDPNALAVNLKIQSDKTSICAGEKISFIATATNGGTSPKYQWKKNNTDISGATSSLYSASDLINNDIIICVLTSSANCVTGNPANSSGITVSTIPNATTAVAGADQLNIASASTTLAANTASQGTGLWSIQSGTGGKIETPGDPHSIFTGLSNNAYVLRWTITGKCSSSYSDVNISFAFICNTSLTDARDNKSYKTILIGTQCWMQENLNVGTKLSISSEQTNNSIIEKYCYNDDENNCNIYGGLYQWDEMMQYVTASKAKGICPDNWHIPSHDEWTLLERAVCSSSTCTTDFPIDATTFGGWTGTNEGGKLKETGTIHWNSSNTGATNESGFTALAGGYRSYIGSTNYLGTGSYFWSSSQYGTLTSWIRSQYFDKATESRNKDYKTDGLSVRCIHD